MKKKEQIKISVLIPCYNEEKLIDLVIKETVKELDCYDYEILFVDDGSQDETWEKIQLAGKLNPRIKGLSFARNFGKEAAISAGIENCQKDAVIIMDADLQHPPKYIPSFIEAWQAGADIVEGYKLDRGKESIFAKAFANLFYRLFRLLSGLKLKNESDFKLLDRKVIDSWLLLNEKNSFFRGLSSWLGYKRTRVNFKVAQRETGTSKWSFFQLFKYSLKNIIAFSAKPLYLIASIGLIMSLGGLALAIHTFIKWLSGASASGFTTVILLQVLIGGTIISSLGLIGIYLAQIFDEIKARPQYLIREKSNFKN